VDKALQQKNICFKKNLIFGYIKSIIMSWKTKGIDDARNGRDYKEPKKDLLDHVGLGYNDKMVDQHKKDYDDGYKIGTSQRVADSNDSSSSSSDGGSGK
jgi:hypothetical protein